MRGGLDETLARMARREEALRRRAPEPGAEPVRQRPTADPTDGRDPVEEVVEAVRRVVADHPGLAVVLRVEHEGRTYPVRVDWADSGVTAGADDPTAPPPAWPMSGRTVPSRTTGPDTPTIDPAARLAEMIRRDPSLLTDER